MQPYHNGWQAVERVIQGRSMVYILDSPILFPH